MTNLEEFMKLLTGEFDNSSQYETIKQGDDTFPLARHLNTPCNDKITNLPKNFDGIFMVEESYYQAKNQLKTMPHLFLFTQKNDTIVLTSYNIPEGYDNNTFTYENLTTLDYNNLEVSKKFTPAVYHKEHDTWMGGSQSEFTPTLTFTLYEEFSKEHLKVSESMESKGKRVFGFDQPIVYQRI